MDIVIVTVRPIRDDEYLSAAQVIRSSILPHLDTEGINLEVIECILQKYDDISLRQKFLPQNLYVAIMNDQLVGVAGLISGPTGVFNRISTLFIAPAAQGKGIGKALIAELEQRICTENGTSIVVNSRVNAEGFYLKQGFVRTKLQEKVHDDGKKTYTVWMEKVW